MKVVALLRGVTPVGKNRIPKMTYLVEILKDAGFKQVVTYIQSGNIILDTEFSYAETAAKIHDIIYEKIGADLSVIIKTKEQLENAVKENPFDNSYNFSRIHLVFTHCLIDCAKLEKVKTAEFDGEEFYVGRECLYMYLPRDAKKKKLNNNYLEKQLGIIATTRKLSVIKHLSIM